VAEIAPDPATVQRLAELFHRNGYVRSVNPVRRKKEGRLYKKGAEVRLVAESAAELREIRQLLKRAGFQRARPFAKGRQWRQPIYGVKEVAQFLRLVGKRKTKLRGAARKD
jgi:hypothetical protein